MRRLSYLVLLCAFGCSGGKDAPPSLYPVTGTVVVEGKPLADTMVQLIPVDLTSKARPGSGTTDAEGKFVIRTNGDKGATAGKFKVVLGTGAQPPKQMSLEEATKMSGQYAKSGGIPQVKPPFPKEWADPKTSPKEVEVTNQAVVVNVDI